MKILAPCAVCRGEPPHEYQRAELGDDLSFSMVCSAGHSSDLVFEVPRYELLFESGVLALVDGYPREAVASCSVAIERFHEFWLEAVSASSGIPEARWHAAWKHVAAQSERQLGAFVAAYLAETKESPTLIARKWVKFRNDVVHKGSWPTSTKAQEYAEVVLGYICPLAADLRKRHEKGVSECVRRRVAAVKSATPGVLVVHIGTVMARATHYLKVPFDLTKDLQQLRERNFGLVAGEHHP